MIHKRTTPYTVQNVNFALELLEALADYPAGLTLPQLAEMVGQNHNKTFRLLATLCEKGLAERDTATGAYCLGIYSVSESIMRQST